MGGNSSHHHRRLHEHKAYSCEADDGAGSQQSGGQQRADGAPQTPYLGTPDSADWGLGNLDPERQQPRTEGGEGRAEGGGGRASSVPQDAGYAWRREEEGGFGLTPVSSSLTDRQADQDPDQGHLSRQDDDEVCREAEGGREDGTHCQDETTAGWEKGGGRGDGRYQQDESTAGPEDRDRRGYEMRYSQDYGPTDLEKKTGRNPEDRSCWKKGSADWAKGGNATSSSDQVPAPASWEDKVGDFGGYYQSQTPASWEGKGGGVGGYEGYDQNQTAVSWEGEGVGEKGGDCQSHTSADWNLRRDDEGVGSSHFQNASGGGWGRGGDSYKATAGGGWEGVREGGDSGSFYQATAGGGLGGGREGVDSGSFYQATAGGGWGGVKERGDSGTYYQATAGGGWGGGREGGDSGSFYQATAGGGLGGGEKWTPPHSTSPMASGWPPVKHWLVDMEVKLSWGLLETSSNVDDLYPQLSQAMGQGKQLLTFYRVPRAERVTGLATTKVPFLSIFRDRLPSSTPTWNLQVVKATAQTHFKGVFRNRRVETDVSQVYATLEEKSAQGARLTCLECSGHSSRLHLSDQLMRKGPEIGLDMLFEVPATPRQQRFVYEAISVPIEVSPTLMTSRAHCDWMGALTSRLSQGWRLVEIFYDNTDFVYEDRLDWHTSVNSLWFFEKPAARRHDATPVWEGCYAEHHVHVKHGILESQTETGGWADILQDMGQRCWELACILEVPKRESVKFNTKLKVLLFFQRPIGGLLPAGW